MLVSLFCKFIFILYFLAILLFTKRRTVNLEFIHNSLVLDCGIYFFLVCKRHIKFYLIM